jgi:anti-anti-sigma factor
MTRTILAAPLTGSAVGSDESAVAVTLSWPSDTGESPADVSTGGSHVIELIGDVDVILAARVRGLLATIATQSSELAVDVSGVQFIDRGGLELLDLLYRQVMASRGRMSLIGVGPRMRSFLGDAGLQHLLSED